MKVTKEFKFDAGHRLMHHKGLCHNLHGHTYVVQVSVQGKVDPHTGMVVDFKDLKRVVQPLVDELDHAMIFNKDDFENINHCAKMAYKYIVMPCEPTAENIAALFLDKVIESDFYKPSVKVWETPTSFAEAWL